MSIDITKLIDQYLEDYEHKRLKKPGKCISCKCEGCLIWHSSYWRQLTTLSLKYGKCRIKIKRVRCKKCGRTFPVLPDFILKYHRYGADVILLAVEKKETHEKIANDLYLKYNFGIAVLTIRSWKKKISINTLKRLKRRFLE